MSNKLSNKLVKSRKAWFRQTTALGATTRRASEAFAADTVDAVPGISRQCTPPSNSSISTTCPSVNVCERP